MECWSFDVSTSLHDDVKVGVIARRWSRVHISVAEFPDWRVAAQVAANMAASIHGGMPTAVLPRY